MEKLYHDMSIDIFIQGKQGLSPRSGQEPYRFWLTLGDSGRLLAEIVGKLGTICTESEVSCRKSAYHMGITFRRVPQAALKAGNDPPFLGIQKSEKMREAYRTGDCARFRGAQSQPTPLPELLCPERSPRDCLRDQQRSRCASPRGDRLGGTETGCLE